RLSTGAATVMAQRRQHLRVALAGKDRADNAQAGRAGDVGDDVVELKIHSRPWTSIFCGSSPILLLTSAEGLGCAIHQVPKRDGRGGVTTLKCATAHGPCFLTGSNCHQNHIGRSLPGSV